MHEQLLLLRSDDRPWRLDDHTRDVGRRGVEEARAALRQAATVACNTRRSPPSPAGGPDHTRLSTAA